MAADNQEEVFDVVDEENRVTGQELRKVVHQQGILHRAVYCFVFNSAGELLLQRRVPEKKIGGNCWDLSCAEHLQPGEPYKQGAQRGLQEELGITAPITAGPLGPNHLAEVREAGLIDREFVESYRLDSYDGPVQVDPAEVAEARFFPLPEVRRMVAEEPGAFTPWFHREAKLLGLLQEPAAALA
mmetsp:Transcript_12034/g.30886  ORF Transcript_12034/g.30886 Transcript_12034/m.30886 type:complete len:185 (-) Transcript_12034:89-643(-)|eukprot:jgi/Tetstr1/426817/TSEL_017032.t1